MNRTALLSALAVSTLLLVVGPAPAQASTTDPLPCSAPPGALSNSSVVQTSDSASSQDLSVGPDSLVLGLALQNHGVTGVTLAALQNGTTSSSNAGALTQRMSMSRDNLLALLAAGTPGSGLGPSLLGCVSDVDAQSTRTTSTTRDVSLDETTVLSALAFQNSTGSPLAFGDVASFSTSSHVVTTETRNVTVDPDDALLLLAFG